MEVGMGGKSVNNCFFSSSAMISKNDVQRNYFADILTMLLIMIHKTIHPGHFIHPGAFEA
jgi:hypothetical protein